MKRFSLITGSQQPLGHPEGEWVRYQDAQARIDDLYTQLFLAQKDRKHYGVHLATALKGEKLASEPVDGRLDAVRELVARNIELEAKLKTVDSIMVITTAKEAPAHCWTQAERSMWAVGNNQLVMKYKSLMEKTDERKILQQD